MGTILNNAVNIRLGALAVDAVVLDGVTVWERPAVEPLPARFGDPYAGGRYAAKVAIGGDYYALVVADASGAANRLQWAPASGAHPSDPWNGPVNTAGLAAASSEQAAHCLAYRGSGHDDWYLPAINELLAIGANLANNNANHPDYMKGGSQEFGSGSYASSTHESLTQYSTMAAFSGTQNNGSKTTRSSLVHVLPVRRVRLPPEMGGGGPGIPIGPARA